jgi:hypothetical protein
MTARRTGRLAMWATMVVAVGTALLGSAAPASAGQVAGAAVYTDEASGMQTLGVIWT